MFFSIIIPVYNTSRYLPECIDNVLRQSFKDYEVLLIDDGSTDGSADICDQYAKKDERIKVIHKENGGLSSARNCGIEQACGEFLLFLDSDDFWIDEDALRKIYQESLRVDSDVIIFGMKKYNQEENIYTRGIQDGTDCPEKNLLTFLAKKNLFFASACDKAIRREFLNKKNIFFELGQLSEDIEWCIKLLYHKARISVLFENFYAYRQHVAGSISSSVSVKHLNDIYNVISKYEGVVIGDSKYDLLLRNFLGEQFVLLIVNSLYVKGKEIKGLLKAMRKKKYLLRYQWYPHVKSIRFFRWTGIKGIRRILGLYQKLFKKGRQK